MIEWANWSQQVWSQLLRGERVPVPIWLPHPAAAGFKPTVFAEFSGQDADLARGLCDGSRIHLHRYANGALFAHLDRIDPERSPLHAVAHWLFESPSGQFAVKVACFLLVARAIDRPR